MDIALVTARHKGGFLPSDVRGLRLWLDAGDSTTIVKDGSNRVNEWRCKAPHSLGHATQSEGDSTKPVYATNTGYFGGVGIAFDGVAQYLEIGSANGAYSFLHKAQGGACYVVCEYQNASASGIHPVLSTATGSTGPGVLMYFSNTALRNAIYNDAGSSISNAQAATNSFATQRPLLFSTRMSSLSGTNVDNRIFRNTQVAAVIGADVTSYPSNSHPGKLTLGKIYNNATYGKIIVREVLIYEGVVEDGDHAILCDYLACKWFKQVIGATVMGDSNALGISAISGNLPSEYTGTFTTPYNVYITQGTDISTGLLEAGVNNNALDSATFGVEMSFAKELMLKYQQEVWLVKNAYNGAVLYGASNSFDAVEGNRYTAWKNHLTTTHNYLLFRGMLPRWKMLMCMGTNNLGEVTEAEGQNIQLEEIIDDMRSAIGQAFPVAIPMLGTNIAVPVPPSRPENLPYMYEGRIAHEVFLHSRPHLYQLVTSDLTYADYAHWGPAGAVTVGQRAAALL